jgi:hypothetical protein
MKNQMLRVELNDGEVLIGKEVPMKEEYLRSAGMPIKFSFMFQADKGIWLLHSNYKRISFLAHDTIKAKTII